jgi:segregation and condensation protein A
MAHRVPINIRVDRFEGPLDLLLYLIQSHELDVSKISISRITDQYLAYVRLMQELDFDVASDFLVMAATLIQWKSKSLLPVEADPNALGLENDDVLSPEDLLRQLLEHQRFLDAGQELARLPLLGEDVYRRPMTRKPTEKIWKTMEVTSLALTFQDLLVKERKRTTILKKETVSLGEKIVDFGDRLAVGKLTGLHALLRDPNSRPETVVSFLATLELGRLKKMRLHQEKVYEEIYVELLESIKGFNTELARGFDSVEEAVDQGIADRAAQGEGHAAGTAQAAALGVAAPDAPPPQPGIETSDADFDRAEDAARDGDSAGPGVAGLDLAAFGESVEPDFRTLLAGTDRRDSAEPGDFPRGAPDGRRDGERHTDERGRDEP